MVLQPRQYGHWHSSLCYKVLILEWKLFREVFLKNVFSRWKQAGTVYPMAWDLANTEVSGVNRTEYYQSVCNLC